MANIGYKFVICWITKCKRSNTTVRTSFHSSGLLNLLVSCESLNHCSSRLCRVQLNELIQTCKFSKKSRRIQTDPESFSLFFASVDLQQPTGADDQSGDNLGKSQISFKLPRVNIFCGPHSSHCNTAPRTQPLGPGSKPTFVGHSPWELCMTVTSRSSV